MIILFSRQSFRESRNYETSLKTKNPRMEQMINLRFLRVQFLAYCVSIRVLAYFSTLTM